MQACVDKIHMTTYRTITCEVEVDLSEFDTNDLIEELEDRGIDVVTSEDYEDSLKEQVENIYLARRNGQSYDELLDDLIWQVTGRII